MLNLKCKRYNHDNDLTITSLINNNNNNNNNKNNNKIIKLIENKSIIRKNLNNINNENLNINNNLNNTNTNNNNNNNSNNKNYSNTKCRHRHRYQYHYYYKYHHSYRNHHNNLFIILSIVIYFNLFLNVILANPVFINNNHNNNPSITQFQSGRNIRHLPCIVRKSGLSGVCMFAIDCIKSNGTHLGTCIDRFYFGSCCQIQIKDDSFLLAPDINDNSIDQNTISHFPHESTTLVPTSSLYKLTTQNHVSTITNDNNSINNNNNNINNNKIIVENKTNVLESNQIPPFIPISTLLPPTKIEILSSSSSSSSSLSLQKPSTNNAIHLQSLDHFNNNNNNSNNNNNNNNQQQLSLTSLIETVTTVKGPVLTTLSSYKFENNNLTRTTPEPMKFSTFQIIDNEHVTTTTQKVATTMTTTTTSNLASSTRFSTRRPTTQKLTKPSKKTTVTYRPTTTLSTNLATSITRKPPVKTTTHRSRPSTATTTKRFTVPTASTRRPTTIPTIKSKPSRRPTTTLHPSTSVTPTKSQTLLSIPSIPPNLTEIPSISLQRNNTHIHSSINISSTSIPSTTASAILSTYETKAPRPRPKPTSNIVRVPAVTVQDEIKESLTELPTSSKPLLTTTTATSTRTTSTTAKLPATPTTTATSKTTTRTTTTKLTPPTTTSATTTTLIPTESKTTENLIITTIKPTVITIPSSTITTASHSTTASSTSISTPGIITTKPTTTITYLPTVLTSTTPSPTTQISFSQVNQTNPKNSTVQLTASTSVVHHQATTTTSKPSFITWTNINDIKDSTEIPSNEAIDYDDWHPRPPPDWVPVPTIRPDIEQNKITESTEKSESPILQSTHAHSSTEGYLIVSSTFTISNTTSHPNNESNASELNSIDEQISSNETIQLTNFTTMSPLSSSSSSSSSSSLNGNSSYSSSSSSSQSPLSTFSSSPSYEDTIFTPTTPISSTSQPFEGLDYKQICGKRMFPEPRIVGGANAAFGRWPWQISLRQWRTSTYLHKCGAALLNENWAITAAHCVDNVPPSDLLLRLGEYDLAEEEEPYGYQERRVQIVASHPQFDARTFEYDLALLRFYEPVVFQPNIIPVCVPESDADFIGQTAYVTGWGRLYEDGPLPSVLQEVSVPVINNTICETMYRSAGYIEHIPHIFICAGWKKGGYDSCEGDSGGPMVLQRDDKRFLLAGVISWGIGCAEPNQPGVYTRISEFRDWINQILQF